MSPESKKAGDRRDAAAVKFVRLLLSLSAQQVQLDLGDKESWSVLSEFEAAEADYLEAVDKERREG